MDIRKMMKFSRSEIVDLFLHLGHPEAYYWSVKDAQRALDDPEGLSRYAVGADLQSVQILHRMIGAKIKGHKLWVRSEPFWKTPPRPKDEPKKPRRPKTLAEKLASYAKHPKRIYPHRGVTRVILQELRTATEAQPVTKEIILNVLSREFPDRDVEKMRTTVNNLVPGRFRNEYGLPVQRRMTGNGRYGFWIEKQQHAVAGIGMAQDQEEEHARCESGRTDPGPCAGGSGPDEE